jgi:uncharacterized protein
MGTTFVKVALITGASSSIGLESARVFARNGYSLVVAARRKDRLDALAAELRDGGCETEVVPVDLSIPSEADRLIDAAMNRFGRIDVLVNNAGYASHEKFDEIGPENIRSIFHVNAIAVIELSRKAVPIMKRQGGGAIINIASIAGVVPQPFLVTYCATKSAVIGFSRSLRIELRGTGIRVTAVCPSPTRTEFFAVASKDMPMPSLIEKTATSPVKVAKAIYRASKGNRAVVYPQIAAAFLGAFYKTAPGLMDFGTLLYRNYILSRQSEGGNQKAADFRED